MMYDLIEVKPKINKKKVAIIFIIVLVVILLFVLLGIKAVEITQKKGYKINNISSDNIELNKSKHITKVNINPNYTEKAKELFKNIYNSNEKTVYLTFDDGPSKSVTPLILDVLKQEDVKATFFVLGARAELNPDILRREYKEGHYIANHGYSHIYGNIYATPQSTLDEYNRTKDSVKNILNTDYDGHLFRFPGGATGGKYKDIKKEVKILLDENNIASIDWNALSQDAAGAKTKEALVENIKNSVGSKNTVVILMHDAGDKILTYEALPEIITYLKEQGYNFKNFYNIMK